MKQLAAVWLDKARNHEPIELNDKYTFTPEADEDNASACRARLTRLGFGKFEVSTILQGGAAWYYIWFYSNGDEMIEQLHELAEYIADHGVPKEPDPEPEEEPEWDPSWAAEDAAKEKVFIENARHPMFRGKRLSWVNGEKTHLIKWGEDVYTRGAFFKAAFPEYKAQEYGIRFLIEDVNLLTISQRTILMYDLLADQFGIAEYSKDEAAILTGFCAYEVIANQDNGTASDTLKKLNMDGGLGRMIKFGVGMKARKGAVKSWCYTKNGMGFQSVDVTWEEWLERVRIRLKSYMEGGADWEKAVREVNTILYCQIWNGETCRLTLTSADYMDILDWLKEVWNGMAEDIPFHGLINGFEHHFVVRREDVSFETRGEAGARYLRENHEELQEKAATQRVKNTAAKKLADYEAGDQLTTAQLREAGYDSRGIARLVNRGVVKRIKRGLYEIISV